MYCPSSQKVKNKCQKNNAIYLVESNKIIRSKLRERLKNADKFCIVGEAAYEDDYSEYLYKIAPNIVIFSSFSGSESQYKHIKKVHSESPLIKKVVLSQCVDEAEFCTSIIAGVKGYCSQNCETDELLRAIELISRGNSYYDNSMSNFICRLITHMNQMHQLPIDKPIEEQIDLTDRELEVISIAAQCDDYEDIGRVLCISKHTVKMHLTSIYKKLGVKNKLQAILKIQNKIYEFKF